MGPVTTEDGLLSLVRNDARQWLDNAVMERTLSYNGWKSFWKEKSSFGSFAGSAVQAEILPRFLGEIEKLRQFVPKHDGITSGAETIREAIVTHPENVAAWMKHCSKAGDPMTVDDWHESNMIDHLTLYSKRPDVLFDGEHWVTHGEDAIKELVGLYDMVESCLEDAQKNKSQLVTATTLERCEEAGAKASSILTRLVTQKLEQGALPSSVRNEIREAVRDVTHKVPSLHQITTHLDRLQQHEAGEPTRIR